METQIDKLYKNKKAKMLFSVAVALIFCATMTYAVAVEGDIFITYEVGIGGAIVGALVTVLLAVNVIPIIANQTNALESNADLNTGEQSLVGTWVLFVIIGVMLVIIGSAL